MSDLANEIRSMVFAFDDDDDGRRDAVRALADRVEVMHIALCNVINRWTRHGADDFGVCIRDGDPCQCSRCLAIDAAPFSASDPMPRFLTEAERALDRTGTRRQAHRARRRLCVACGSRRHRESPR